MRQPRPKPKHHLREATPEQAAAVMRNEWTDPIGGEHGGRTWVDTKLPRRKRG